jgi:hypothetical protein
MRGVGRISFWVRAERGGEVIEFSVGRAGDSTTPYSDSVQPAHMSYPAVISDQWKEIEIDLAGADLSGYNCEPPVSDH